MHIFISAGEPSGDLHAGNLFRSLKQIDPDLRCAGYGGERLATAGGQLLYPLTQLSVMWFPHVLKSYRTYLNLIERADAYFRDQQPDAVVLIDYPGLHWWLARKAKARGIPVFYFVPPQLWAWGGWRVGKMRRFVDHVLCSLPFEPAWYERHGIQTEYFGHPYFDELQRRTLDESFVAAQQGNPGPVVAVLPGSREQEIRMNWPSLLRAMRLIHQRRPDARFLVAAFSEPQGQLIANSLDGLLLPVEVHVARTAEIIRLGTACLSVSGSVGLELLYDTLPSVVVYRIRRIDLLFLPWMMKVPYVSIVNLLADEELFPEFLTHRCPAEAMAERILTWLNEPPELQRSRERLRDLKERVAIPGACDRAAKFIVGVVRGSQITQLKVSSDQSSLISRVRNASSLITDD